MIQPVKPTTEQLLSDVCVAVQLSSTQFDNAREKYEAVAKWLEACPVLKALGVRLYPQGSVAIGTTVRPIGKDEHDVDLVLEVSGRVPSAMWLYEKVVDRLNQNETYGRMLVKKKRCVTLAYAGEFHMDVLSALHFPQDHAPHGHTAVLVPDRDLEDWTPSNPLGYKAWFLSQAEGLYLEALRKAESLPVPEDPERMPPLKLAVQLMKRRRDVYFAADPDSAPRSIVLTTLAGLHYRGQMNLLVTLDEVISSILSSALVKGEDFCLPNPANARENFAEGWEQDDVDALSKFLEALLAEVRWLNAARGTGLDEIAERLTVMFGEADAKRAMKSFGLRMRAASQNGSLRVGGERVLVAGSAGIPIRRHDFYGE